MGCWHETDGITQLPIHAGDQVRLFVLVKHTHWKKNTGGGTCYSNDLWSPIGMPVQGTYDDYGGIEDIVENFDTEILANKLREGWVPFTDKYKTVSNIKDMPLSEMLHWIERGNGIYKYVTGEQPLGIMFMLEEIYQAMINYNPIVSHHDYENRTYEYMPLKESINQGFKNWYVKALQSYQSLKSQGESLPEFRLSLSLMSDMFFDDYRDNACYTYKLVAEKLIFSETPFEDQKVQELLQSISQIKLVSYAMEEMRKMWHPQCGKGSQGSDLDLYKKINQTSNNIMDARDKKFEEDNGGDPHWFKPDENGYYPYMIEHNQQLREKK